MAAEETSPNPDDATSPEQPASKAEAQAAVAGPEKADPVTTSAKKKGDPDASRGELARRKFVWVTVFAFLATCVAATVRFFFPRALFEPKTRFVIGYPSDFIVGVSTKFQQSNRIWVVRDSSSIYVLFARCTHLGCTPDWKEAENKFKCPCHGSGFDTEGINFEGPAPRPLERVHVELDAEGRIVVDRAKRYGPDQWKDPAAFLPI